VGGEREEGNGKGMYAPLLERMDVVEDVRLNRDQSSARLFWARKEYQQACSGEREEETLTCNGVLHAQYMFLWPPSTRIYR
jgi:hypothetical protein